MTGIIIGIFMWVAVGAAFRAFDRFGEWIEDGEEERCRLAREKRFGPGPWA